MIETSTQKPSIRSAALNLLARREHSAFELSEKLQKKFGCQFSERIHHELETLKQQKLLCDQRFAESFTRARLSKGHGPIKVSFELAQKGLTSSIINPVIEEKALLWQQSASRLCQKKFSAESLKDYQVKAKCMRFLASRGFSTDQINDAIDSLISHTDPNFD